MGWLANIREAWREADQSNYRTLSGRVFNLEDYSSWGNSMYFTDFEKRRIVGWIDPFDFSGKGGQPRVNDEIRSMMQSGQVGRYIVTKVEKMRDPRDMFFATVEDIGYVGEAPFNKWIKEAASTESAA